MPFPTATIQSGYEDINPLGPPSSALGGCIPATSPNFSIAVSIRCRCGGTLRRVTDTEEAALRHTDKIGLDALASQAAREGWQWRETSWVCPACDHSALKNTPP